MRLKLVSDRLEKAREAFGLGSPQIFLASANVDSGWTHGDGWRQWEAPRNVVRGESNYAPALRRLTGKQRGAGYLIPVEAKLLREPRNPYDSNAFRVEVGGKVVGYLAREVAAQFAGIADPAGCKTMQVCAVLRGGSPDCPNIGVHLWLDRRRSTGIPVVVDGGIVSWPPSPNEGVHCSADEAE